MASTKDDIPLLGASEPTTRSSLVVRWLVLFLSALLLIGNYYCYDNPAALKSEFKTYFTDTSVTEGSAWEQNFSLLYSVYSFPNTVLPFVGGYLVDRFGWQWMNVWFAAAICVGQAVFALGGSIKSFPLMLAGRVLFGLGGESLTVASSALLADWFAGKELAFSLGVALSVARSLLFPLLTVLLYFCHCGCSASHS